MSRAYIGTSGWVYKHWIQRFYPIGVPAAKYLAYYAQHFETVEINYSFYRLPGRDVFARWRAAVPDDFLFAVKASRYLTHLRKLREPAEPLRRLLEAVAGLEEKQGPILFQFPAHWRKDLPRLQGLLELLPAGSRYAFEFRHESWLTEDVLAALRRCGCALCIPDHPDMPRVIQLTANFAYVRFHRGRLDANYRPAELALWTKRIQGFIDQGADVYAFFNNDVAAYAVKNAAELKCLLGGQTNRPPSRSRASPRVSLC